MKVLRIWRGNVLDEGITFASTGFILLQLNKLELAEWFENIGEIVFGNAEMDVTNIEPVEWCGVLIACSSLGVASLAVLLRFSQLRNDGNS